MPLVTSKEMLSKAQKGGYAVGAFNAENMEMVKAIIQAAEELKAPVKYGTVDTYAAIVAAEAKKASVPVCLHLDHGSSFELAMQAIHAGYTSVMIDGSKLDFEANIAETKRVADVAKALDIPCEAELGKVGGKEDDLEAEADTNTDPQEAKEFVERTGVTSLAVAIGTAHGFYVGTPVLDKERLSEIREVVDIPLVLHGASGLSDEDVMDCVKRGICKVSLDTLANITEYLDCTFSDILEYNQHSENYNQSKLNALYSSLSPEDQHVMLSLMEAYTKHR